MPPTVGTEQGRHTNVVFLPYRNVEIVVCPRDRASVEVDGPTAEQPVIDPLPFE